VIEFSTLSCRIGSRTLLREISCTLAPSCIAVIGPNGAGKSTLLRLCADGGRHLSRPCLSGSLTLDDQPLRDLAADALAIRRAFLPQQHAEALQLPVADILELAAWPHGGRLPQETRLQAVALWELQPLLSRPYAELSGGERQRVQLARTWLQMRLQPLPSKRIWLLDEPQNSLDLPHQQRLRECLQAEAAAGALVMFSTHDINFALRCANTILALKDGRLVAAGSPEQLAEPALLQAVFGVAFDRLVHPVDGRPWLLPH
jgi:iron complex transport system ATP-binding protein